MKREMSSQAKCAKEIRKELKETFPNTKFSVKSEGFAGGNSVYIHWTDGPTSEKVDEITKKYQYGSFNGMNDLYEFSNDRKDLPQAKYVMTARNTSKKATLLICKTAKKHYGCLDNISEPTEETLSECFDFGGEHLSWYQLAYRILRTLDLTNFEDIVENKLFQGGSLYKNFKVVRGIKK